MQSGHKPRADRNRAKLFYKFTVQIYVRNLESAVQK